MTQMFTVNGTTYSQSKSGYFFKTTGKKDSKGNDFTVRIGKAVYEKAFDEYINERTDVAEADEWENEMQEAKEQAKAEQEKSDKAAEDALNKRTMFSKNPVTGETFYRGDVKSEKKASKPRRSKDVAYDGNGVTLTAKQVDFIHHLPDTNFYENGLESVLWCDVLTEEIGGQFAGKPMTVGAMISTLREKDLVQVGKERVNGHMAKFMGFTDLGKKVATELGL